MEKIRIEDRKMARTCVALERTPLLVFSVSPFPHPCFQSDFYFIIIIFVAQLLKQITSMCGITLHASSKWFQQAQRTERAQRARLCIANEISSVHLQPSGSTSAVW